jgi:hypothetical protein
VANYMQRTAAEEGYLVAEMVRTGKAQTIALSPPVNASAADEEDQLYIQEETIRVIAMRKAKLDGALKKGYDNMLSVFPGGMQQLGSKQRL